MYGADVCRPAGVLGDKGFQPFEFNAAPGARSNGRFGYKALMVQPDGRTTVVGQSMAWDWQNMRAVRDRAAPNHPTREAALAAAVRHVEALEVSSFVAWWLHNHYRLDGGKYHRRTDAEAREAFRVYKEAKEGIDK